MDHYFASTLPNVRIMSFRQGVKYNDKVSVKFLIFGIVIFFNRGRDLKFGAPLRYRKIASSNTSRLEAHIGFFRLLMKGIFGPYVL